MTQELKCVHRCEREKCPHTEEEPVGTFLGFARKPKYPDGWIKIEDRDGVKHAVCPDCAEKHFDHVDKFIKGGKKSDNNG